jgi:hypothetical protein
VARFDAEGLEMVAAQCYNWGLQEMSLAAHGAGRSSEKLIGMAQKLLPFCPGIKHHSDNFMQVNSHFKIICVALKNIIRAS